jgi:hypothetical protein
LISGGWAAAQDEWWRRDGQRRDQWTAAEAAMGVGRTTSPIVRGLAYVVDNAAAAYKKSTPNVQSFATNVAPQKPCDGTPIHGILT